MKVIFILLIFLSPSDNKPYTSIAGFGNEASCAVVGNDYVKQGFDVQCQIWQGVNSKHYRLPKGFNEKRNQSVL